MEQTQDQRHDRLEAAIQYARQGWKVFPCIGKKPLVDDWENEATDNLLKLEAWWARWPDANLGLPAGANGYVVVDVDPAHGGTESLRLLAEQGYDVQTGLIQETGTGGLHLFFKHPANGARVKTTAGQLGEGLDVRADGGYVVIAPSVHPVSGRPYRWKQRGEASEMPAWLNLTQRGAPRPGTSREASPNGAAPQTEGGRNDLLTREAGSLRARGYSGQALAIALNAYNQDHCSPPLPIEEVNEVASSVARYDRGQAEPYERTDHGNARRFVDRYGDSVRYVADAGKWLCWSGTHWEEDQLGVMLQRCRELTKQMVIEAHLIEDDQDRHDQEVKFAYASQNVSRLEAMLRVSRVDPQVACLVSSLDRDLFKFAAKNGTIDLRTGLLDVHRPSDLMTKVCDVPWDSHSKCPQWWEFLDRIFAGKQELISYVQRLVGYCLTGSTDEQKFFFLYGTGANGKSTFVETIREVVGSYASASPPSTFTYKHTEGVPNDVARLVNARLITTSELESGARLNTTLVKQLCGGDRLTARYLHHEFFEFKPAGKLLIVGNHRPEIRNFDEGLWRRLHLVPFEVTIPLHDRDPKMMVRLASELPGILKWAVEGCLEWQKRGLDAPQEVLAATESYRAEQDVIGEFLELRCAVHISKKVMATPLYEAYRAFIEARGVRPDSQTKFGAMLAERGLPIEKAKTKHGYEYRGIGLIDARVDANVEM